MAAGLLQSGIEYIVKDSTARGTAGVLGSLKRIEREVKSTGTMFKTALGVGLGYMGISSIVGQVRDLSRGIDAAAKASDRLGMSTESYTSLGHAANLAGIGVDQLTTHLEQMSRKVVEAAQGTGAAKNALAELGLDAQALAQQDPQQMLYELADAMSAVENPAERLRIATSLFGDSGARMVNMLQGGSEALRETQDEAYKLGLAISRVDAAKVEEANEAMIRLRGVVTGALTEGVIALAPYVEAIATHFVDAAKEGEGFGATVFNAMDRVGLAASKVLDIMEKIASLSRQARAAGYVMSFQEDIEAQSRARYEREIRAQGREPWIQEPTFFGSSATRQAPKYGPMYEAIHKQVAATYAPYYDPEKGGGQSSNYAGDWERAIIDIRARAAQADERIAAELAARGTAGRGGTAPPRPPVLPADVTEKEKAREAADRLYESLLREQELIGRLGESHYRAADMIKYEHAVRAGYADDLALQTQKIEEYRQGLERLRQAEFVTGQMQDLAGSLTDVAMGFETAGDALENFLKSATRAALNEFVMQPLTRSVGSWIMGPGPQTQPTPATTPTFGIPGTSYGAFEGRAGGGSVWPGQPYWVGERGRELFVPSQAGQVVPSGGGGYGGPKNLSVKIFNEAGAPVEAAGATMDVDLHEMVVSVMLRDYDTGGPSRIRR